MMFVYYNERPISTDVAEVVAATIAATVARLDAPMGCCNAAFNRRHHE